MSVERDRERHEEYERLRAMVGMREAVAGALAKYHERAGSAAVIDAVDEALAQIVDSGDHVGDSDEVKQLWILCAKRRLIDQYRSAESKHRGTAAIDDQALALALSPSDNLSALADENRSTWRIHEILGVLRGDQRRWAEAWYDQVLAGHPQPRGLDGALGWSHAKTEKTSQRARKKLATFAERRGTGAVCAEQRAPLHEFIAAGANRDGTRIRAALGDARYERVLLHVAACEDCWTAWYTGRRTVRGRLTAVLVAPLGHVATAAAAIRAKLAGLVGSVHNATYSVRQRLGIGGGAAAAGGGAATLGGKAAAICAAAVCTAGAAGGALVEAVPTILPAPLREAARHPARKAPDIHAKEVVAARAASYTPPVTPPQQTTTAAIVHKSSTTPASPSFTPGELPPASSQTSSGTAPTATIASQASAPSSGTPTRPRTPTTSEQNTPTCTLGELTPC